MSAPGTSPRTTSDRRDRARTISLVVIATVVAALALKWLKPVLLPLVLAVVLTYLLGPLVDFAHRRARMPGPIAVTLALIAAAIGMTGLGAVIGSSVRKLSDNAAGYEAKLLRLMNRSLDWIDGLGLGLDLDTAALQAHVSDLPIGATLMNLTGALADIAGNTFLVLFFAVYLLMARVGPRAEQPNDVAGAGSDEDAAPPATTGRGGRTPALRDAIDDSIRRYLGLKVLVSAMTGIGTGILLRLFDVELAAVFGLLAFVLNFIPSVGSIIATLLPLPVVLLAPEMSVTSGVLAIVLPGLLQFGLGNVLEPALMGDSLDLHPIVVLLTLILWGMLWGVAGMLLATPITAVMKILMEASPDTRAFAELLAGRMPAQATHRRPRPV